MRIGLVWSCFMYLIHKKELLIRIVHDWGFTGHVFVVTCCLDFRNRYPDRSNDDK